MSGRALGILLSFFALWVLSPQLQASDSGAGSRAQKLAGKTAAKAPADTRKKKAAASKATSTSGTQTRSAKTTRMVKATKVASKSKKRTAAASASVARKAAGAAVAVPVLTAGELAGLHLTEDPLSLRSNAALVVDQYSAEVLFEKNADVSLPIASLTKLMTALVVLEARQNLDEVLEITSDDIDRLKNSGSRLRVGTRMTRREMLHLALMSSENRAASALGRHYPGGLSSFVQAMNARARSLGMQDARFVDSTGLSSLNQASAQDLAKLALEAYRHPLIREYSTHSSHLIRAGGHQLQFRNSNRLVNHPNWEIGLQKTGYISEAGRCLIMQARVDGRPVIMVFLDSRGKDSRLGDAARVRKWLETEPQHNIMSASARHS